MLRDIEEKEYLAKHGKGDARQDAIAYLGLRKLARDMLLVMAVWSYGACGPIEGPDPEPREPDDGQCDPGYVLVKHDDGDMCEPIGQ
jgi:hypothetical protein